MVIIIVTKGQLLLLPGVNNSIEFGIINNDPE